MDDQIDPRFLERFLAGDCTDEERERVLRWVDGIPERQALLHALRTAWTHLEASPQRFDTASAWNSVASQLKGVDRSATSRAEPERVLPNSRAIGAREGRPTLRAIRPTGPASGWRVAAAILVMAGAVSTSIWWSSRSPTSRQTPTAAPREVSTPRGQRAKIQLSDGSVVTLAPESRLREAPSFGVATRDVSLDGEAYFEIAHDPTKPFRVHTARAVARDIGTKFLVRAYAGSPDVRVVVDEGIVSLRRTTDSISAGPSAGATTGGDSLLLRPRDLGRLDDQDRLTVQSGVALDEYTAWTSGRLVFTNTPLSDAIPRLARWYDVDLRLGDADLGRETFTATLTHEPMSDVVRLLAATVRARVERRGDTLILFRRRVQP